MSKCDLEVVLANPGPFAPGEPIEGFVGVTVNVPCHCNGLKIAFEWHTHGRGSITHGSAVEEVLFVGEWKPGERHIHPFALVAPTGPLTFHGTLLNVDWRARASADLPWAFDPKDDTPFELVATAPIDGPVFLGPLDGRPLLSPHAERALGNVVQLAGGLGCMGTGLLVGLATMSVAIGACFGGDRSGFAFAAFLGLFAGAMLVAGGKMIWGGVGRVWGARQLGSPEIVAPEEVRRGDDVPIEVVFTPTAAVQLPTVRAALVAMETVATGSGKNRRTYREEVFRREIELATDLLAPRGQRQALTGRINLPPDAPVTFAATDNSLAWTVQMKIDTSRTFDFEGERPLRVRPA